LFEDKGFKLQNLAYLRAIQAQSINYEAWESYATWLTQQKGDHLSDWKRFHTLAIKSYAKYPEVAWMLISRYAYPHLLKGLTIKEKMKVFGEFHAGISGWGPNRWKFDKALKRQSRLLGGTTDDQFKFFYGLLLRHKGSSAYLAPTLAWGQETFKHSPEEQKRFVGIVTRAINHEGGMDQKKALYSMANQMILAAEKHKDIEGFALAGSMLRQMHSGKKSGDGSGNGSSNGKGGRKAFKPAFPGELLSDGAFVRTSGTCGYDVPWKHYFLPSKQTGFFHTPRQSNPWVEITMKQFGEISGIEIVNWTKFRYRAVPLKVEISEDGRTWHKITVLKTRKAVWKIDLRGKHVRGRFLRLTKQGKDFLHLNNIRVYGKRRS